LINEVINYADQGRLFPFCSVLSIEGNGRVECQLTFRSVDAVQMALVSRTPNTWPNRQRWLFKVAN